MRRRKREKGKAAAEEAMPSWASSWARYIRGNVVSEHAARLIRRFLSLTLARSGGDGGQSDDDGEPELDGLDGHAADPLKLSLDEMHKIIRDSDAPSSDKAAKRLRTTKDVRAYWSQSISMEGCWDSSGNRDMDDTEEIKTAVKAFGRVHGDKVPCHRASPHKCLLACEHVRLRCHCVHCACNTTCVLILYGTSNQAPSAVGHKRKAAASIYSHGGIAGIRKWLDALQAFFVLYRASARKSLLAYPYRVCAAHQHGALHVHGNREVGISKRSSVLMSERCKCATLALYAGAHDRLRASAGKSGDCEIDVQGVR